MQARKSKLRLTNLLNAQSITVEETNRVFQVAISQLAAIKTQSSALEASPA